jgi:hypothetical protein
VTVRTLAIDTVETTLLFICAGAGRRSDEYAKIKAAVVVTVVQKETFKKVARVLAVLLVLSAIATGLGVNLPSLNLEPLSGSLTTMDFLLVTQLAICYRTYYDATSEITYFMAEGSKKYGTSFEEVAREVSNW